LTEKKKILIIYEYFYPAYKAGGIIQSLKNLVSLLHPFFDFYCITGARDLNEQNILSGIIENSWNKVNIGNEVFMNIWYDDKRSLSYSKYNKLFKEINPDIFYINGFMSIPFLLLPLWVIKTTHFKHIKIVVAPRGMLQEGAVSINKIKKVLYLFIIQKLKLMNNISWHITNYVEKAGILKYFNFAPDQLYCISNIPASPVKEIFPILKQKDTLNLVYTSIITEKKNLHYLIIALKSCKSSVYLSIYGVIKEQSYWSYCKDLLLNMPDNVVVDYKGAYKPEQIQDIVSKYDAMVLLSKGENFSHAIYESLSAGRPVISSNFTSWDNLKTNNAGWNFQLNDPELLAKQLDHLATYSENDWLRFSAGAFQLANTYIKSHSFVDNYLMLFHS